MVRVFVDENVVSDDDYCFAVSLDDDAVGLNHDALGIALRNVDAVFRRVDQLVSLRDQNVPSSIFVAKGQQVSVLLEVEVAVRVPDEPVNQIVCFRQEVFWTRVTNVFDVFNGSWSRLLFNVIDWSKHEKRQG